MFLASRYNAKILRYAMLKRWQKILFYIVASPFMGVNALIYRRIFSPKSQNTNIIKVHLGPGRKKYIPGWINVDVNKFTGKCDVWANFNNSIPFRNDSIDAVYSHHVIEHLSSIENHLKEIFRILKPGGACRLGAPNGDSAIKKFIEGDTEWFGDFPHSHQSIGGRFNNFILCANEHLHIITESYILEITKKIGFSRIHIMLPGIEFGNAHFKDVLSKEHESDFEVPHTLIFEITK